VLDVTIEPGNASGGAGAVSTAADYLRFAVMMQRGGELDGRRVLSPTTVSLMTSDHLGSRGMATLSPGELLMGVPGYTFGLGFMVRQVGDGQQVDHGKKMILVNTDIISALDESRFWVKFFVQQPAQYGASQHGTAGYQQAINSTANKRHRHI